jgi:hypothetical protein
VAAPGAKKRALMAGLRAARRSWKCAGGRESGGTLRAVEGGGEKGCRRQGVGRAAGAAAAT